MVPLFIRLHNTDDNSVVIVNINNIVCVDSEEFKNRLVSKIYLSDTSNLEDFCVNESPEKIYDMIEKITLNK